MSPAVAAFLLACSPGASAEAGSLPPGVVTSEFIYETAPYPSCHASTIVETKTGLVAAWFGGTAERNPDVGIWVARREDGKWTAPVEVANGIQPGDQPRQPTWNPVLFQPKDGPLMLFYKVGPSPQTWWGELKTSEDGGKTWSEAKKLPEGFLGPIKNKPVTLADGSILCPSSVEKSGPGGGWRLWFERTADLGKTWTKAAPSSPGDPPIDAIQPSILFHPGGKRQALGRAKGGKMFEVWSDDGGTTWGQVTLMTLPNPSSGTDAVTMNDGRHALVYNHVPKGRIPLNLAISKDGKVWQAAMELDRADQGQFSYPAVIQTSDGLLHITYTYHRKKIKHVVVDPTKLVLRDMPNGEWPK